MNTTAEEAQRVLETLVRITLEKEDAGENVVLETSYSIWRFKSAVETEVARMAPQLQREFQSASRSDKSWKAFLRRLPRLHLLEYSPQDMEEHPSLQAHILPNDERVALRAKDEVVVDDARLGQLLWDKYMRWDYLLPRCLTILGDCIRERSTRYGVPAFLRSTEGTLPPPPTIGSSDPEAHVYHDVFAHDRENAKLKLFALEDRISSPLRGVSPIFAAVSTREFRGVLLAMLVFVSRHAVSEGNPLQAVGSAAGHAEAVSRGKGKRARGEDGPLGKRNRGAHGKRFVYTCPDLVAALSRKCNSDHIFIRQADLQRLHEWWEAKRNVYTAE